MKEVMKCNCQCWQCATKNHEGCESHSSVCNVEWMRLKDKLNESNSNS